MNESINETLAQRNTVHGDFTHNSSYAQAIKNIVRSSPNYPEFTDFQKEALEMIAHKMGRILVGDHRHKDHWHDIAGYATLVENRL